MPGRQWIGAVLRAKCHHHKCERIQRAGVVGRITEWEEGPDSVELCGVCRLTHVGSVPLWFDHQRCDFPCYRCTNTYCIYVYVVLIHTIYIDVLHWSLMVMDSPSCGHCAGHGGGEETTLDHVTCHVTSWKVTVFFVDLIKDCFHWHVHLNAIVNPVCVILYSIV